MGTYVTVWSIIIPNRKESQSLSRSLGEHAVALSLGHLGGVTSPLHGQIPEACEQPLWFLHPRSPKEMPEGAVHQRQHQLLWQNTEWLWYCTCLRSRGSIYPVSPYPDAGLLRTGNHMRTGYLMHRLKSLGWASRSQVTWLQASTILHGESVARYCQGSGLSGQSRATS